MESSQVRAVAQVRFPFIPEIQDPASEARIRQVMGDAYPVIRPPLTSEKTRAGSRAWKLSNGSSDPGWNVTLGPDSVSLESNGFSDRLAFLDRMGDVVSGVLSLFRPGCSSRVGLRLTCEVDEASAAWLFRPEFLGVHGHYSKAPVFAGAAGPVNAKSSFGADGGATVSGRWGERPGAGHEFRIALGPAGESRWGMDIELHRSERSSFEANCLKDEAVRFADSLEEIVGCMASDWPDGAMDDPDKIIRWETNPSTGTAICEIRLLSGLDWEELADLFGVASTSEINSWAGGIPLSKKNETVVYKMLAAMRHLYQGLGSTTHPFLMKVNPSSGKSRFGLLKALRFEDAVAGVENDDNLPPQIMYSLSELEKNDPPLWNPFLDPIDGPHPLSFNARGVEAVRKKLLSLYEDGSD